MNKSEREALLSRWADPPSNSEQVRCENAERVVKSVIAASTILGQRDIRVFVQGSYRNNTNVRLNSDVDICVCLAEPFFTDYTFASGLSDEALNLSDSIYSYEQFKKDVGSALISAFGSQHVKRGNKAFNVRENTYRIESDVVACFELRRYHSDQTYVSGTQLISDKGEQITNWPEQHHSNGVTKNNETGRRFKRLTRILKNLRNTMVEEKHSAAVPIPSYLNECLVWNTPSELMGNASLSDDVRSMLIHLWQELETEEKCGEWGEVNEMKYLFRPLQAWTRTQARAWIQAAWTRLEYK